MKKYLFLTLTLILFTCKSDDDISPADNPINSDAIAIDIDGLTINYSNVTVLSTDDEKEIALNGVFENPYTYNGIEDLPVLFVENEELLFGYFPHTLTNNNIIAIDDVVLFYYMMYPQISNSRY